MPSDRAILSAGGPPSFERLDERLADVWDDGVDGIAAVAVARQVALKLLVSSPDVWADFRPVSHAAEALWDNSRVGEARRLVEGWRKQVISVLDRDPRLDPFEPRVRAAILTARLEHRANRYETAFTHTLVARRALVAAAGSVQSLKESVGCSEPTLLGELLCANNAIAIPSARVHFRFRPELRAQYLDPLIDEAANVLLTGDLPARYERGHALVCQTLFAIAERGDPADAAELRRLSRIEVMLRPPTARAQATKRLPRQADARFRGDVASEAAIAARAKEDLLGAGLHRHLSALSARGWWSLPG